MGFFVSLVLIGKTGRQHNKATEIYTHVSVKSLGKIRSPLDNLSLEGGGIDKI